MTWLLRWEWLGTRSLKVKQPYSHELFKVDSVWLRIGKAFRCVSQEWLWYSLAEATLFGMPLLDMIQLPSSFTCTRALSGPWMYPDGRGIVAVVGGFQPGLACHAYG